MEEDEEFSFARHKWNRALECCLEELKTNISVPEVVINNKSDWLEERSKTLLETTENRIEYFTYLYKWTTLLKAGLEKELFEAPITLASTYNDAIEYLPIKLHDKDTTWKYLIQSMYAHIICGDIEDNDKVALLTTCEKKFAKSFHHGGTFYLVMIKGERLIAKDQNLDLDHHMQTNMIETFQKCFSFPYLTQDSNTIFELFNSSTRGFEPAEKLRDVFYETQPIRNEIEDLIEQAETDKMHNIFHGLVDDILSNSSINLLPTLNSLSEWMLELRPYCPCFYFKYLSALSTAITQNKIEPMPDKMDDLIRLGVNSDSDTDRCCPMTKESFCEQAIVIAGLHLSMSRLKDLIFGIVRVVNITTNPTKWLGVSRGCLTALGNKIRAGEEVNIDEYLTELIKPFSWEYFSANNKPPLKYEIPNHEIWFVELLRLRMAIVEGVYNSKWEDLLREWTGIFIDCSNPTLLAGYVEYVKNRGSSEQALEAVNFALQKVEPLKTYSLPLMRCHIKLLKDKLDILRSTGTASQQIEASDALHKWLAKYNYKYPDNFDDLISSSMINGFFPNGFSKRSCKKPLKSMESQESGNANVKYDSNSLSVANGGQYTPSETEHKDLETFENQELKVFVVNLDYKVKEEDLVTALNSEGVFPSSTKILKDKFGQNRGQAILQFPSAELAELAIKDFDHKLVGSRPVKMFHYIIREQSIIPKKFNTRTKEHEKAKPTTVTIFGLDPKYKDKEAVVSKLSAYAHVKDVVIKDTDSTFTVQVEFHFTEDAQTVHEKIKDGDLFGEEVKSRLGFISQKNEGKNVKKLPRKGKTGPSSSKIPADSSGSSSLPDNLNSEIPNIGPQIPPELFKKLKEKPKNKTPFVPRSLAARDEPKAPKRTHMSRRVGFRQSSPTGDSVPKIRKLGTPAPSEEELVHNESQPGTCLQSKPLSNKDFQDMLKKQ
ncbi:uncharacterized protein LOC128998452 [Macrosteles quadrilineatus]|uniref:uncharacterized protein LOC128998452 n=1 Tax=Macrosteles quadrilineatus TaxID=74068 RepID=UPI0023E288BA|nr:uncharacterized protein LOC128998452 [Macrosteles quadrilineatus]